MKNIESISFVIPCLNEESTLGLVLNKIKQTCSKDFKKINTEIIVSDNGSSDNSEEIAMRNGARVVHCKEKGYGSALVFGIDNSKSEVIIFADADNTYDFTESPKLVEKLNDGYDFIYGSRLEGNIQKGAMPFLHRYFGTPILNFLINLLFAKNNNKINDCNSGFRCFFREKFITWNARSKGMEFASEMIINAMKNNAKISSVPITLHRDSEDRIPHLNTWRDGMRHFLQILVSAPEIFSKIGLFIFAFSWIILMMGLLIGPTPISGVKIFGIHSMMVGTLLSIFSLSFWSVGLFISINNLNNIQIYKYLINFSEDKLFWLLFYSFFTIIFFIILLFFYWAVQGYNFLSIEKETLIIMTFLSNMIIFHTNLIAVHILKKK